MEFLDLSDANDDEKAQAMAIIGSDGPINGVEFPFDLKSLPNDTVIQNCHSFDSSQPLEVTVDSDVNRSAVESQSLNSTPSLRHESPIHELVSHSSAPIETSNSSQWEMNASTVPVVCAPTQYIYPSYFPANPQMVGQYFTPLPNNGHNKIRSSASVVNAGKPGKPIHSPDIRGPFYTPPNQYTDVQQILDGSRQQVPTTIVSDAMILTNGPPMQPMFTTGFPPTFLQPHSPFPTFFINTPEGPQFFCLPPHGVPMPRPSSPPSVPNISNSANTCEVPSDSSGSQTPVDEEVDDVKENCEEVFESNNFNENNDNIERDVENYTQNETIIETNVVEVKVSDNENNSLEPLNCSETHEDNIENSCSQTTSASTETNNTATNVWSGGNSSQRSWADLFKGSSSASIHNSLMTSSTLSSQTSGALTTGSIVSHNYDSNLSESDSHLNSSVIISENEAQIQCIPMRNDPFARKLAKRVKQIGLKHFLPYLIPAGLVNRGNWCYINATLQALVGCPPFYNLLRELGDISGLMRERSSTPIIDSFAKFFSYLTPCDHLTKRQRSGANLSTEDMPKAEPIEPRCIYEVLGSIKSECLKGRQEDAEEFLSSVLNGLHEEMIALLRLNDTGHDNRHLNGEHLPIAPSNGHVGKEENGGHFDDSNDDDDSNLWKEVSSRHKPMPMRSAKVISTPIVDIFGGSTLSVRTAGKDVCGNRQPFFALQLDIQSDRVKSVEDALKCLTTSESIQGYMCPKTKQAMDASAQIFLDTLPPILILHLKLFVYDMDGGCRKLMKRIEYPVDLELPKECLHYDKWEREKNLQLKRYKLLSVVYHDGSEAIKGHYVTDVFHIGSNQWLRYDDQSVKVIQLQKVLNADTSRTPYLLFYRRSDTLYNKQNNLLNQMKTFSH